MGFNGQIQLKYGKKVVSIIRKKASEYTSAIVSLPNMPEGLVHFYIDEANNILDAIVFPQSPEERINKTLLFQRALKWIVANLPLTSSSRSA